MEWKGLRKGLLFTHAGPETHFLLFTPTTYIFGQEDEKRNDRREMPTLFGNKGGFGGMPPKGSSPVMLGKPGGLGTLPPPPFSPLSGEAAVVSSGGRGGEEQARGRDVAQEPEEVALKGQGVPGEMCSVKPAGTKEGSLGETEQVVPDVLPGIVPRRRPSLLQAAPAVTCADMKKVVEEVWTTHVGRLEKSLGRRFDGVTQECRSFGTSASRVCEKCTAMELVVKSQDELSRQDHQEMEELRQRGEEHEDAEEEWRRRGETAEEKVALLEKEMELLREEAGGVESMRVQMAKYDEERASQERRHRERWERQRDSSRPRREHPRESWTHRMYPHHRHSSVRYVLVDIGGKDDYLPRKRRKESRAVDSRPRYDDYHQYVQLYSRTNKTDVTREEIAEQLLRNLAIARHNTEIASRPALPRPRRVHFGSVTNYC